MKPAPLPTDQAKRLRQLQGLRILDTAVDPAFAAIARLVSQHSGWPVAVVSQVDAERQWFAAADDFRETPRTDSICVLHAIAAKCAFEVPDAGADPRFADNPRAGRRAAPEPARVSSGDRPTYPSGERRS